MWVILLLISCSFVTCFGRPADNDGGILDFINDVDPDGSYKFRYRTEDGSEREESGKLENDGKEGILKVQGFYEYLGFDGKIYKVTYEADENGYRAKTQSGGGTTQRGSFGPLQPQQAPIPSSALASLAGGGLG